MSNYLNNRALSTSSNIEYANEQDTTNKIIDIKSKRKGFNIQYGEDNIQKSLVYIDSIKTTYSIAFCKGVEYGYALTENYLKEMFEMENKEMYEKLLVSNDSLRKEIKGDINNLENKIIERFDKLDTKFDSKIDKTNDFVTKIYGDTQTLTTKVDAIQVKVDDDKNKFRAYLPFIILGLIGVGQAIIAIVALSK